MKKEHVHLSLLMITILLFASLFLLNIASATQFDPIKDMFFNWEQGHFSENIAKYLFTILLALLIWSVIDTSDLIPKSVSWLIAGITAFLSVAYITPKEIFALMLSSNATGMAILTIFPLMILFIFSYKMVSRADSGVIVFQKNGIGFLHDIFII